MKKIKSFLGIAILAIFLSFVLTSCEQEDIIIDEVDGFAPLIESNEGEDLEKKPELVRKPFAVLSQTDCCVTIRVNPPIGKTYTVNFTGGSGEGGYPPTTNNILTLCSDGQGAEIVTVTFMPLPSSGLGSETEYSQTFNFNCVQPELFCCEIVSVNYYANSDYMDVDYKVGVGFSLAYKLYLNGASQPIMEGGANVLPSNTGCSAGVYIPGEIQQFSENLELCDWFRMEFTLISSNGQKCNTETFVYMPC